MEEVMLFMKTGVPVYDIIAYTQRRTIRKE